MQIDDETLMAFADGELDPATTTQVAAAIDADPDLQARLRLFSESRNRLQAEAQDAFAQSSAQDAQLIARIRAASVVPANTAAATSGAVDISAATPGNINRRPLAAIAAALALALIGGGLWWQLGDSADSARLDAAQVAALDNLPSGEAQALDEQTTLTMIASYRNGKDELCREFETHNATGMEIIVACRDRNDWSPRFAMDVEAATDGYVPAAGELEELDAFLANTQAGAPLTPEEEAAALAE